jgi:hypothetical protein
MSDDPLAPQPIRKVTPRWRGVPKDKGVPPEQGVPPEAGIPREQGIPKEAAVLPGTEGQLTKGAPGQVSRGAPGQMDPWAENPWAPGEGFDETWTAPPPLMDDVDEEEDDVDDAFYLQHPNFFGMGQAGKDGPPPSDDEPKEG